MGEKQLRLSSFEFRLHQKLMRMETELKDVKAAEKSKCNESKVRAEQAEDMGKALANCRHNLAAALEESSSQTEAAAMAKSSLEVWLNLGFSSFITDCSIQVAN